jgi:hypothetical protein
MIVRWKHGNFIVRCWYDIGAPKNKKKNNFLIFFIFHKFLIIVVTWILEGGHHIERMSVYWWSFWRLCNSNEIVWTKVSNGFPYGSNISLMTQVLSALDVQISINKYIFLKFEMSEVRNFCLQFKFSWINLPDISINPLHVLSYLCLRSAPLNTRKSG